MSEREAERDDLTAALRASADAADDLAALRAELAAERERADRAEKELREARLTHRLAAHRRANHADALADALREAREDVLAIFHAGWDSSRRDACQAALDRIDAALSGVPTNERETGESAVDWRAKAWETLATLRDANDSCERLESALRGVLPWVGVDDHGDAAEALRIARDALPDDELQTEGRA